LATEVESRADEVETDAGPGRAGPERTCIATRTVQPVDGLIRFVVGPEENVVPDIRRKLPGRGVWVSASRGALETAVKRNAFARGFKRPVKAGPDLVEVTERLLEQAALDALSIAHKAGLVLAGFSRVEGALGRNDLAALLHASDAAPDGVRKLAAALRQGAGERGEIAILTAFTSAQLDLALGRSNVIHAALLAGPGSEGFLARYRVMMRFRASDQL
jgi:uncharacterized protein